jgi:NAD(P)-dependent dehydrogenase (short-subunit alcohol dehydrogenase family)
MPEKVTEKVIVVTGANAGIGKETAVGLASQGATTVLACRNLDKAAAAAAEVKERSGNDRVHVVALDLSDLASVRDCASIIQEKWDRLDVLVNNAGGMWSERATTRQGFEQTFGVNHLGPFYLTVLLVDRLAASATSEPSRVVNLASVAHHTAIRGMRWDDLQAERRYTAMGAYGPSKLANVLFTRGLARRLDPTRVTANAAHPGAVRSQFGMDGDMHGIMGFGYRVVRPFQISPKAGARTSIFLALDPSVATRTGGYWAHRRPAFMSLAARDDAAVERLWSVSEDLLRSVGFQAPGLPWRDLAR